MRWLAVVFVLCTALGVSLSLGSENVTLRDWLVLSQEPQHPFARLLWHWRLPRVLTAALIGALLGMAGAMFQGVFRNPLAEPYLLGSAPGAALGATLAILAPLALPQVISLPLFAFCGAFLSTILVIAVSRVCGVRDVAGLLLAGVAISAFLSAARSFVMLALADESVSLQVVLSWTLGGVQTPYWHELAGLAAVSALCGLAACACATRLDLLGLGEDVATNMGINVPRFTVWVLVLASLLVALAVTWGGTIGFVGLVVPHVARVWGGAGHRFVLPMSALLGAALLMVLDGLARALLPPADLPLGLLTALVGAPFFIAILAKWGRR